MLIRHGATRSNAERRYLGKREESLSIEGISELKQAKEAGIYPELDLLFVSPMKRCLETAMILYEGLHGRVIEEWSEMDFGSFEGKNYKELAEDERYQNWIDSGGRLPFPDGEDREDFIRRCRRGFEIMQSEIRTWLEKSGGISGNREKNVGIIAHGGTIMALLYQFYGGDYFDYQTKNAGGYLCRMEDKDGKICLSGLRRL